MKKIINGRKYDTETAKELARCSNGASPTSFAWFCETLYRKKTGEFFLLGEGGANSKYCEWIGGSVYGTSRIIPYTIDEAKAWVESKLTGDEYEAIFGAVDE